MEQVPPRPMTPFDCLNTPGWLHTLKLMLPYIPPNIQRTFAMFIRFQEMRYTLEHFKVFRNRSFSENLFNDLKPYMEPSDLEMMEQMESMMSMLEIMQNMKGDFFNEFMDESSCDE